MSQGEEKQYQIGDILSLNCTSGRSQPKSILTFYINDEAVSKIKVFILLGFPNELQAIILI